MGSVKPLAGKLNGRLVVVSNRGACTLQDTPQGRLATPSVSGLVSALEPVLTREGGAWIAWGGRYGREGETIGLSLPMPECEPKYLFHEVLLSEQEIDLFYRGFANGCLWPLCHNFIEKAVFQEEQWHAYRRVNEKFAEVVLKSTAPQDYLWVHDFQLALLPGFIRQRRSKTCISLFWHIPFPPAEIFATLPWAGEIIKGMLNADLIGFHTANYLRNFLQAAEEIAGAEADYVNRSLFWQGRKVLVTEAPIGIDWQDYQVLSTDAEVIRNASAIKRAAGGEFLLLGVDRLDYTKGIPERLKAIEWLLEQNPGYRNKLSFVQVAVPSRTETPAYRALKRQIEEMVGYINGKYTENYHVPVKYIFKSLNKKELAAHYLAADMALVTPVKDGLNLVAKEYVAANFNNLGVLLLSPFAGAAGQLKEALFANPYHTRETAEKIKLGLTMPLAEKKRRLAALNRVVREQDIFWWWQKFRRSWLGEDGREVVEYEPVAGSAGRDAGKAGGPGFKPPEMAAND